MNTQKKDLSSLETKIGLYWLHRIGIVSLVFGIVFLITYSIQLCGNPFLEKCLKLGSGIGVSIALLFLGRKLSCNEEQNWFGHGLTAGGWSIAYFTTYAAHFISDLQVISSIAIETALLALVAAGSLMSALRARSELMAIYSLALAGVTILLNGPGLFGDISFLIIAIAASILGNVQSWRKLFACAMAACYAGHFFCSFGSVANGITAPVATGFLFLMWMIFSIGIGCSRTLPWQAKNTLSVLACVNAIILATGFSVPYTAAVSNLQQILLVVAGILSLGFAHWQTVRKDEQLQSVHSLLGLYFINIAKCMHFSGLNLLTVDILQIALLAVVGLKFRIKTFQWVAVLLAGLFLPFWYALAAGIAGATGSGVAAATVFGFTSFEFVPSGFFAAAAFLALAYIYSVGVRKKFASYLTAEERESESFETHYYHLAACLMFSLVFAQIADANWQAFAYTLLGVGNLILGIRKTSLTFTGIGIVSLLVSMGLLASTFTDIQSLPVALICIALFFNFGLGKHTFKEKMTELTEPGHWLSAYLGTILLTLLILYRAPADFVSLGLGVEGIVFVIAGFLLKEKFFRYSGLSMLALLSGKLLFVDLAHFDTFQRIVSFIAAGIVFLTSSYAYGKFTRFDARNDDGCAELDGEGESVAV